VAHLSPAHRAAAGLRADPSLNKSFAATQAAWRFYGNDAVTLPQLAGPPIECAHLDVPDACDERLLVVLDWSNLHYCGHDAKVDRVELAHSKDLGYELLTALAVSDRDGSPIAPLCLDLRASNGVHSTRANAPLKALSALDGLAPVMEHIHALTTLWGKKPVFVIDREADSVGHFRQWRRSDWDYLVRADDERRVLHEGQEHRLDEVARLLKRRGAFTEVRPVEFQGKPAEQFIAETIVVLHRPARTHRVNKRTGKATHKNVAGEPLPLRLVISEVRDELGRVLARWLLLVNLSSSVPAATVALWYYWRWRIESYHKLLKGAGQEIECWQQETPEALARRLTVAAMACVVVWRLARDDRPQAAELRDVLVRLSGRQMKRGKKFRGFTEPALLAGLGVLIPMLLLLQEYDVDDLRRLAAAVLPNLLPPPARAGP
jgi:Transposase DDE domain